MVFTVPPLMVMIPAMLPFGVQITPALVRLMAALAVIVDGPIEIGLGLLDRVLALRPVVGVCYRHRNKPRKRSYHNRCYCCPANFLNHVYSLSVLRLAASIFPAPNKTSGIL
jgi:hypothetical protein